MSYKLYTDKTETFKCKIHLEGAELTEAKSRLVIESPKFNLLFEGTINTYSIEDDNNTTVIGLEITSQWGQFEKENGRTTSDNSQQRHFSGDKGFEFSALTIRDIKWGRT